MEGRLNTRYLQGIRIWWALRSRTCPSPWKCCNRLLLGELWSRKPSLLPLLVLREAMEIEKARVLWEGRKRPIWGNSLFNAETLLFNALSSLSRLCRRPDHGSDLGSDSLRARPVCTFSRGNRQICNLSRENKLSITFDNGPISMKRFCPRLNSVKCL